MNTKNILKTLALVMLIVPACNKSEIANDENADKKGFALPVTVNVTREGDNATKATYNESTRKLEFSAGDKLFVNGQHSTAGQFAGTLEYDAVSGKFSGTIYTQNGWTGTADALFTESSLLGVGYYAGATLLPDGYGSTGFLFIATNGTEDKYDDRATCDYDQAFALTKAAGVEQLSREEAGYYDNGFVLMPSNAILNFTITGLAASTEVAVVFTESYYSTTINKNVTTDGSGNATFAIGLPYGVDFANCALTVGGLPITLTSNSKTLAAGKIYTINRSASAPLPAVFTVDAGKTVKFSKGNLQATYNGSSWIWGFAEHQWDYIGNAAGNTSINGNGTLSANGTVDLFGWVGASSTWTGAAQYGISNSTATNNVDGYGNVGSEAQKVGWGATVGAGWRTLTKNEWLYLLSTRETGITVNSTNHARYTLAIINTDGTAVKGLIIFPDSYAGGSPAGVTWGTINAKSTFNTTCTSAGWTALEAAGCVFLPAAGYREASTVKEAGVGAGYWSSSSSNAAGYASGLYFESDYMSIYGGSRKYGFAVRLVRDAD